MTVDPDRVAEQVDHVRERIRRAGGADVRIVAVTKTFGSDAIGAAMAAGLDAIGENYAQELVAKMAEFCATSGPPVPEVHFIGRLQSNKVRSLVGVVDVFETVDRRSLVDELVRRAPGARILVQVDTTAEPGKGGCPVDEVPALVADASQRGLRVEGLMTVGPTSGGPEAARAGFRTVRRLVDELGLATCSMGMSDDLEVAVAEGATQVRLGSALFGSRPPRP